MTQKEDRRPKKEERGGGCDLQLFLRSLRRLLRTCACKIDRCRHKRNRGAKFEFTITDLIRGC